MATVVQRGGKVRPEPGRGGPWPAPSPIHTKKFGKVRPEVRGAGRGAGQEYKYKKNLRCRELKGQKLVLKSD